MDINSCNNFQAPLRENSVIGNLDIYINGVKYFSVDILNKNLIKRKNILDYLYTFGAKYINYYAMNLSNQ